MLTKKGPPNSAAITRAPAAVAGVGCAGPMAHAQRHWHIDRARRLHLREGNGAAFHSALSEALRAQEPIPGEAAPLACDPFKLNVLLHDASVWGLSMSPPFLWRAKKHGEGKMTNDAPVLLAAGQSCDTLWYIDTERRAWSWTAAGKRSVGAAPVPGSASIVAIDLGHLTVVLETGERWCWLGSGWLRLPAITDSGPGAIRVRILEGIVSAAGHLQPGEFHTLPEQLARDLIVRRVAVVAD